MSHELICTWLGLQAEAWPPDHYRLLGLSAGESDPNLIEERVHQRLDAVRRYQMAHPDQATEAMNRIAQAFVCLTEPASKRVYDAGLLGTAAVEEPLTATLTNGQPLDALTATVEDREPLVLVYNAPGQEQAPPVQRASPALSSPPEAIPVAEAVEVPIALPASALVSEVALPPVRYGLAAKRYLYGRIVQTRALLDLWNQAGKYLASPKRRLSRLAEVNDLTSVLNEIRDKLKRFPPLIGEAGQPGYLVVALAQLGSLPMFQMLVPSQRDALSRDWEAGRQALLTHRASLRREARAMRGSSLPQRLLRAVRNSVVERPGRILVALALLAITVALLRTYVPVLIPKLVPPKAASTSKDHR